MTSSVIRRNAALSQLDEQFEKFFAQYDEDQIGALDTEEIDGYRMNDQVLENALEVAVWEEAERPAPRETLLRGVAVSYLTPEELGGAKDIAEAWAAGTLRLA